MISVIKQFLWKLRAEYSWSLFERRDFLAIKHADTRLIIFCFETKQCCVNS